MKCPHFDIPMGSHDVGSFWIFGQEDLLQGFSRSDRAILLHSRQHSGNSLIGYIALSTGADYTSSAGTAPLNTWIHIVGVWSGSSESVLYVNGESFKVFTNETRSSSGKGMARIGYHPPHWQDFETSKICTSNFEVIENVERLTF